MLRNQTSDAHFVTFEFSQIYGTFLGQICLILPDTDFWQIGERIIRIQNSILPTISVCFDRTGDRIDRWVTVGQRWEGHGGPVGRGCFGVSPQRKSNRTHSYSSTLQINSENYNGRR